MISPITSDAEPHIKEMISTKSHQSGNGNRKNVVPRVACHQHIIVII